MTILALRNVGLTLVRAVAGVGYILGLDCTDSPLDIIVLPEPTAEEHNRYLPTTQTPHEA